DCGKLDFVIRGRQDVISWCRFRIVRVDEVHETVFRNAFSKTIGFLQVKLIPTHVRHSQMCRKFHNAARKKIKTAMVSELLALAVKKMHTQTNTEGRSARMDFVDERRSQTELVQITHSIAERSDARQNQFGRSADVVWIGCNQNVVAESA